MSHDVFVSYSSDDKRTADAVCVTLEKNGIRCWMAPRDILPGADWGGAIVDAINVSRVMVLVYSAKANTSPQIKREVERAVNRGLSVIPLRIEDVPMSPTLEYFMSTPHWLDALTPPLQDHLDRLAETVRVILQRAGVAPSSRGTDAAAAMPRPLVTSSGVARSIGRWVRVGAQSPTLGQVFVPPSDRIARTGLIAAGAVAISLFAQVWVGPVWLQPLAVLMTGSILGSRAGALAATIHVGLGIVGFPVYGPGIDAWTPIDFRAPYVRYGLGYLACLPLAAFTVGWLTERRSWDRHWPTAARLAVVGTLLLYVPGALWLEVSSLLMREPSAPAGVLPSIPMLVITVAVMTFGLPWAWDRLVVLQRTKVASAPPLVAQESSPPTAYTNQPL